jgi:crotonobetaine/carnitine-CoA ligase
MVDTLSETLADQARRRPSKAFLRVGDVSLTYQEAHDRVDSFAAGFQRRGVHAGDRVLLVMDSSVDHVVTWLALNRIGAINVPANPGLTPFLLSRAIQMVDPSIIVIDAAHAATLATACHYNGVGACVPVYVNPDGDDSWRRLLPESLPLGMLAVDGASPEPTEPDPLATATMLFTSGSTGVPKACELSHAYLVRQAQLHSKYLHFEPEDVLFTPFPLFHIDGATLTVGAALVTGATAALSARFSASRFWDQVRQHGATVFNFMGATANMLWKQPPTGRDRDHPVRLAWGVPMPACEPHWRERFGFDLVEVYGLTDAGVPAYQPLGLPRVAGSCGRIIDEYEIRIGDPDGNDVPVGQMGEILIRSDEPGLVMNGYYGMPEATQDAFRGGWFHTNDFGRVDEHGNLYFAARGKEVIRRRGENIAATDVEAAIDMHPLVLESAAVGVPSDLSEDDIRVFVVLQSGQSLTPEVLAEHARDHMPRYMMPRYIDIVDHLPKTPTEKIERFKLGGLPITADTWDAQSSAATHHHHDTKELRP